MTKNQTLMLSEDKIFPELIYYCEYLSELNDKTGRNEIVETVDFTLSDNYSVDIELNNVGDLGRDINIAIKELSEKKDNWNHGFFGEYIQCVSAIVGKNGSGKTTILRNIYSKQPQLKYEILVLYKIDDNNFMLESSSAQVYLENPQVNDKTVSLRKSALRSGQRVEDITPVCLNIFSRNILDGARRNVNYAIDDQIIALISDTSYAATYNLIVDPLLYNYLIFNIRL